MDIKIINNLSKEVVELLIKNNLTISSVESCTGGLFSKLITDVPGCSKILNESYVTYSNEAKSRILGVSNETLEKYGAVSYQTATEMAQGLSRISKSNICVSFTGIAGPGGGTKQKPVGLVYTALCINEKVFYYKLMLEGTRDEIRHCACYKMLDEIKNILIKKNF